jgi:ubiquinone/menaquinone biosynthesis C-methylase UbiE
MPESYYQEKGLFKGTAWYYARYRPPYPADVFQLLANKFQLDGSGKLLDLGCGPGDLAIPLSSYFEKVVALDTDADMLSEGRQKALQSELSNIQWVKGRAEEIPEYLESFKLVTIGKAFHWMDQKTVLTSVYEKLASVGGIAIVAETGSLWGRTEPWHSIVLSIIKEYLGDERRAGTGVAKLPDVRWDKLLDDCFSKTEFSNTIVQNNVWNVDSYLGYLYSTSFCSRAMLNDKIEDFEHDLKIALLKCNPDNCLREHISISVLMGWK